jgi:hypothetical protein
MHKKAISKEKKDDAQTSRFKRKEKKMMHKKVKISPL